MRLTSSAGAQVYPDSRRQEILSAQVRLLYANANLGVGITILAATMLGFLQWGTVPNFVVTGWWLYMTLVSLSRLRFGASAIGAPHEGARTLLLAASGEVAFAVGAGLAGAGWGGAGILLYPEAHLANQVFLVFVLGGMMLGAASVLAPRPEAYLAFLIPIGSHPCGPPSCPG